MPKFQDLTGQKYGRLTVLKTFRKNAKTYCKCICECGKEVVVLGNNLKRGFTKSCGCLNKDSICKNVTHHLSKTKLYSIFCDMKRRCYNNKNKSYKDYGEKGIIICQEWLDDFMNFYNWAMANSYKDGLTIDRIDVNGNYEPSNCRWADIYTQANNKRTNRFLTYNNETHTLADWARIYNINYKLLFSRLKKGWEFKNAVETKPLTHSESGKLAHSKKLKFT